MKDNIKSVDNFKSVNSKKKIKPIEQLVLRQRFVCYMEFMATYDLHCPCWTMLNERNVNIQLSPSHITQTTVLSHFNWFYFSESLQCSNLLNE